MKLIEAWSDSSLMRVLINPREVVEVYRGKSHCNVKMKNGTLHRFSYADAEKVYAALRDAEIGE